MKETNKFVISNIIIALLKIGVTFLCRSYAMLESALFDLEQIIILLFSKFTRNKNDKFKGIFSALISFLIILASIGIIYVSFTSKVKIPSAFILLFIILFIIIKYAVSVFVTNKNYSKKQGIICISTSNSTLDYYNYGVILASIIIGKISKWFEVLKYSDRVATILIALLVIFKALKDIYNSFKAMNNLAIVPDEEFIKEISLRNEIKTLDSLSIKNFGGYSYAICDVAINENISMIDINSFMITMSDYLLKLSDMAVINMTNATKKKTKVIKRVKPNAGNSRSRNSKTNTKKKNTKKTNKKR